MVASNSKSKELLDCAFVWLRARGKRQTESQPLNANVNQAGEVGGSVGECGGHVTSPTEHT